jgi:hypothetical protein
VGAAQAPAQAALVVLTPAVGALRAEDVLAPSDSATLRRGRSGQMPVARAAAAVAAAVATSNAQLRDSPAGAEADAGTVRARAAQATAGALPRTAQRQPWRAT